MDLLKAQFHGHSHFSDGLNSPTQIIKTAIAKNLNYIALTDHNSVAGIEELYQSADYFNKKLKINILPIAGTEYKTPDGEILLLKPAPYKDVLPFLTFCRQAIKQKLSAFQITFQAIKHHQALVIFPHPIMFLGLSPKKIRQLLQDLPTKLHPNIGIEIHNAAMQIIPMISFRDSNIKKIATSQELQHTSNADYHSISQLDSLITHVPYSSKPSYKHLIENFQTRKLIPQKPYYFSFFDWTKLLSTQLKAGYKTYFYDRIFTPRHLRQHLP